MSSIDPFEQALRDEGILGTPLEAVARATRKNESGGRADAVSNRGARGSMQVMPGTFGDMADQGWDINNPYHSDRAGIRYLKKGWEASGGDLKLTGAYYYGGPGGMAKAKQGIAVHDPVNPHYPNTLQYANNLAKTVEGVVNFMVPSAQAGELPKQNAEGATMKPQVPIPSAEGVTAKTASVLPNTMAAMMRNSGLSVTPTGGGLRQPVPNEISPEAIASLQSMRETKARMLPIAMGALMSSNWGANQFGQEMAPYAMSAFEPTRVGSNVVTPDGQVIKGANAGASSYYQPIQTAQGVMAFNSRTGQMEQVLDANGKPIIGMQADPALQGALAGAKKASQVESEALTNQKLDAPNALRKAEYTIGLIDNIIQHPGRQQATGFSRAFGIQHIPGTNAKDFDIALNQIKGQQFLEAFESLKGGGQITQIEGEKATQAISRMEAAGSEDEFLKAAMEFRMIMQNAAQRARMQLSGGGQAPSVGGEGLTPEELAELEELRRWKQGGQ